LVNVGSSTTIASFSLDKNESDGLAKANSVLRTREKYKCYVTYVIKLKLPRARRTLSKKKRPLK
jgi:hypothetical protein